MNSVKANLCYSFEDKFTNCKSIKYVNDTFCRFAILLLLLKFFLQLKIKQMGFFDKLKNKAKDAVDKVQSELVNEDEKSNKQLEEETVEIDDVIEDQNDDLDDDENDDDDLDVSQMPKGWENLSDDEILGKLGPVALEYNQRGEDESYLKEQGFENEDHLMGFTTHFQNMVAQKRGISLLELIGQITQATQNHIINKADTMKGEGGIMEPVEGVSCEDWAKVNAKLASGISIDDAIKEIGADLAKWDNVNNEWQTRMSNDTTFTISQIYGNAFNASATGNLGSTSEINEDNFPYEKYMEIMVAQDKLTAIGRDPQEILSSFGLTVVDWSNASAFWSQKFNQNVEKYYEEHTRLTKKFEEKYKSGSVHNDIEF